MKFFFYFPEDLPVTSPPRCAYFEGFGYTPLAYSPGMEQSVEVLLLATTARVGEEHFATPGTLWKQYFRTINDKIKIIEIGVIDAHSGPNYFHWLRPPSDFVQLIVTSKTVAEGWVPRENTAEGVEEIWKRFWSGHNKGGFYYFFANALTQTVMIQDMITDQEPYDAVFNFIKTFQLENHLEIAKKRWKDHEMYWRLSPFYDKISEITHIVEQFGFQTNSLKNFEDLTVQIQFQKALLKSADAALDDLFIYFKPSIT